MQNNLQNYLTTQVLLLKKLKISLGRFYTMQMRNTTTRLLRGGHTNLIIKLSIRGNGQRMDFESDEVFKYGRTVPNMKATGATIWPTGKVDLSIVMAMCMKANG